MPVLERAEKLGVLSYAFELKEFENKADYGAIVELLDEHQLTYLSRAIWKSLGTLLAAYEIRVSIFTCLNFQAMGLRMLGMVWTVWRDYSWVDSGVDTGKVIKQVRVPRLEGDTLDTFETRIHDKSTNFIRSLG